MQETIIVAIAGSIWENHAYSLQGFYICKMFLELNFNVVSVSYGTLNKELSELQDFEKAYHISHKSNISKINNPELEENLKIYKSIKYYILEEKEDCGNIVFSSKYNKIVNKVGASYLFILGDFYRYVIDEPFDCKTIAWYPNHFEPIDFQTANVLRNFDKILCLYPSAVSIIKKTLHNVNLSYAPHIIDYEHINKTKLSKKELRQKYNLPSNTKIITLIGGNYEKNMRKGFDVALQVFKKTLETRQDIYFFMQCFTINLERDGFANDIQRYIDYFDIPENKYFINNKKVPDEILEEIYGFTDVLLVPSKSEGFCLPIIEAQIREIPVVSNKFTAMRDYTFYGKTCDYEQLCYDGYGNGLMSIPSVRNLTDGLLEILDKIGTKEMNIQKNKALDKIKKQMSYDNVKTKIYGEIMNITKKEKYYYCFFVKNAINDINQYLKVLSKNYYVIKNINELFSLEYNYLVILHNESKIDKHFFDTVFENKSDIILKTKLKNNRIYPISVDCIVKNDTENNFLITKHNFAKYTANTKFKNFDELYNIIKQKSFINNNLKINDDVVVEYI